MDKGREVLCLLFTVAPVIGFGIDTRSLPNIKAISRTDNYSRQALDNHNVLYSKDEYLDLLHRVAQSYRNSYTPFDTMRRTLRSFQTNLGALTSAKREKEEYEDLQNLQYYGSEIPKKFSVKRLFSPKYFRLLNSVNTDYDFENQPIIEDDGTNDGTNSNIDESGLDDLAIESKTPRYFNMMKYDQEVKSKDLKSTNSFFQGPGIINDLPSSGSAYINLGTTNTSNTSESLENTAYSMNDETNAKSKRTGRAGFGRFAPDVCNMADLEIDIRFQEMMDTGAGLLRLVCTGSITVNKCEGTCNSHVKPSVNNYDGFERQCKCCKDYSTTLRTVTLSMCTLGPEEVHGYSISRQIVEPTSCTCQQCRN